MKLNEKKCIDLVRRGCDVINQTLFFGFKIDYVRKIEGSIDIRIRKESVDVVGKINLFFDSPPTKSIGSLHEIELGHFKMFIDKKRHEKDSEFPEYGFFTTFLHEMIHVSEFWIYDDRRNDYEHDGYFLRLSEELNQFLYKIEGKASSYVRDDVGFVEKNEKKKYFMNPSPTLKAQKMFEDFNHYPAEKIVNLKLPINSKTVFAKLGEIENLEYLSDKKIFASDQKTAKRKIRTYIHNFSEHGKRPMLLTNEAGNILILYDPENPIEVKPEGII